MTYEDLRQHMIAMLNLPPDDARSLSELAALLQQDSRRRGHNGALDVLVGRLANFIDAQKV